ncbi:MAG: ribbon-helix-helix protein, CopG family [Candidatus Hodarchaeales archaeon]
MSSSKHIQSSIPLEEYEEIKRIAEKEGKTLKEVIRESLKLWLGLKREKKTDPLFQTNSLFEGPPDIAEKHDDIYS